MVHVRRRAFLGACAAVAAAPAWRPRAAAAAPAAGPSALGKPVGIQLYSVRKQMPADVAGTLARIRAMGFTEVEGGDTYKLGVEGFAAALKKAGLTLTSEHHGYEQWRDDTAGALRQAKSLGARYVGCAWIPHGARFTREDALRAAADFNKWGKAAGDAGLRFFYHAHGYEFEAAPEGTLLDTILKETDPALVALEADVFWIKRGGGDPVKLFRAYPGRVPLTHLKDMKKGLATDAPTGQAPDDSNVVLGTGQIEWRAVLEAANAAGVERHYIEDESAAVMEQVPRSLKFLAGLEG